MTIPAARASPGRGRLLLGFALMPLSNFVMALVVFPLLWSFAILTGVIAVVITVAGAVPVVHSLMKRGAVSLKQLLLAGLALGNAPFAVYAVMALMFTLMHVANGTIADHLSPLPDLIAGTLRVIAIGSFFGMASAAIFWAVAILGTDASSSTPTGARR